MTRSTGPSAARPSAQPPGVPQGLCTCHFLPRGLVWPVPSCHSGISSQATSQAAEGISLVSCLRPDILDFPRYVFCLI